MIATAVLAISALHVPVSPPAAANAFAPAGGLLFADNSSHSFYLTSGVTGQYAWAANSARGRLDSQTDMTQVLVSSYHPATDVIYYAAYLTSSWYAYYLCMNPLSATVCGQGRVVFNTRTLDTRPYTQKVSAALHEVGHSVGLGHSSDPASPMYGGGYSVTFTAHDKGHIDGYY